MRNKEFILKRLDAIIEGLEAENNKSKLAQKDLHAFKTLRRQYSDEDIAGIKHSADNLFETATREMLPMECGELMGFEPLHEPISELQTKDTATSEQAKEEAIINIGIEMDYFEEHLRNLNGFDQYSTTAQAFRKALEAAYDAGLKAKG